MISIEEEREVLSKLFDSLEKKASAEDPTLTASVRSIEAKMLKQMHALESKIFRAKKRKSKLLVDQITEIKDSIFPNQKLQERTENFIPYYLRYGPKLFEILIEHIHPLQNEFLLFEEND